MYTFEQIKILSDSLAQALVALRRDLHKYAETGWFEMRTASIVARQLTDLGYEVLTGADVCDPEARMGVPGAEALEENYRRALAQGADPEFLEQTKDGFTGVIGILRRGEGPTLAMRFDMDALGVVESQEEDHLPQSLGFGSVNTGAMHACGHDGHTAIGLGVARVLMDIKDQLQGTVKLIFQPAEEGVRGAKAIVEKGHLNDVQFFLSGHVHEKDPEDPSYVIPGSYGSLATCKYDVVFRGSSSHAGGAPHLGNNALLAAATAVVNLHAIPRHSQGATRINVGTLHAGSGRNVIADRAKMEMEVRGSTTELNAYMQEKAEAVLRAAAQMYGCSCEIKLMGAAESLTSDKALAERVRRVCTEKLGVPVAQELMAVSEGSEDVAYMMNRVQENGGQACFMRLLTPMAGPLHNPRFDIGEEVLTNSVKVFCAMALDILG